jgi:hypothetical protein
MPRKRLDEYNKEKPTDDFTVNARFKGQIAAQLRKVRLHLQKERGRVPTNNILLEDFLAEQLPVYIQKHGL